MKQQGESERAYAAFQEYLRMGPSRSLASLGKRLGKTEKLLERWPARWNWQERVAEHTAHLARLEAEVAEGLVRAGAVDWVRRQEERT